MTIEDLIRLFNVSDVQLRGLQEVEVVLQQQHRVQRILSPADAALYMACRAERIQRQHAAISIQPIDDRSRT